MAANQAAGHRGRGLADCGRGTVKMLKKGASTMKKLILIIAIVLLGASAVPAAPAQFAPAYDQKDKKKDPPGPPVVKPKGDEKPKEPPPKRKPNNF